MNTEHYKTLLKWLYGNEDPTDCLWEDPYVKILDDAMQTLDPRFERILRSRLEGETARRIGEKEGVTSERIRQIVAKSLRQLRHPSRLGLGRYISEKYLCEFEGSGEMASGAFEHEGVTRTYEYERKRCKVCKEYSGERDAPDLRCARKSQRQSSL